MSRNNSSESRIHMLDESILQVESFLAKRQSELKTLSKESRQLELRQRYYLFAAWFRSPAKVFNLWQLGVLLCGPLIVASACFAIALSISSSLSVAIWCAALGALAGVVMLSLLFYYPSTKALQSSRGEINGLLTLHRSKAKVLGEEIQTNASNLRLLQQRRIALTSSIQFQCERLLKKNWKALRGEQLEDFLASACAIHGYSVERTGRSGDQGVDLVIQRSSFRWAIQVKGYANAVGNDAVQQAVAGMRIYDCNRSAVITNSRFTQSAIALATANQCVLISEETFVDFVMGQITLE